MCDLSSSRAIIVALGGWQPLAGELGVHQSRTHRWQSEGIPHVRWPAVMRVAQAKGVPLTYEQLASAFEKDNVAPGANASHGDASQVSAA